MNTWEPSRRSTWTARCSCEAAASRTPSVRRFRRRFAHAEFPASSLTCSGCGLVLVVFGCNGRVGSRTKRNFAFIDIVIDTRRRPLTRGRGSKQTRRHERCCSHPVARSHVNGGVISGRRGGVKVGQWRRWLLKHEGPPGGAPSCFRGRRLARPLIYSAISPVSGSMVGDARLSGISPVIAAWRFPPPAFRLFGPVAVAVHFEDVDVRQPILFAIRSRTSRSDASSKSRGCEFQNS